MAPAVIAVVLRPLVLRFPSPGSWRRCRAAARLQMAGVFPRPSGAVTAATTTTLTTTRRLAAVLVRRPSASSDGSSDGSDRSRPHRRHGAHSRRERAARERWGREAFRAIRRTATRSFVSENGHYQYRKRRNAEEALAWCAALDALLATRGVTGDHPAVEVAVRRLVVVREADRTNSWAVAKALTIWSPGIDIGTMEQHRRLRRDVAAIRTEEKDSARDRTTGGAARSRRPRSGVGSTRSTAPVPSGGGGGTGGASGFSRGGGGHGARRPPRTA